MALCYGQADLWTFGKKVSYKLHLDNTKNELKEIYP